MTTDPSPLDPRHRFLLHSGWLDRSWYDAHAPVGLPSGADPIEHYLTHGAPSGLAPNPTIALLQDPPERTAAEARELHPPDLPHLDDPQLLLEVELIRASGLFDAAFYADKSGAKVPRDMDPLLHFCHVGWRRLFKPRRDFDPWWYWVNHLDPGHEEINPFVHYVLLGEAAGLRGSPVDLTPRISAPAKSPLRRVVLFAGYDADGVLDEYVVDYVRQLSRHADVFYLCDGVLEPGELAKLDGTAKGAWAIRHGAYDFGSYAMLARDLVGWDTIETYDELLFVNDSCYLLGGLDEVFAQMEASPSAWWGLQATAGLALTGDRARRVQTEPVPLSTVRSKLLDKFERQPLYDFHIGSYFLAYRKPVINDVRFRHIVDSVHTQRDKLQIVMRYEIGLTHYLIGNGYDFDTFVDALYPFHPMFTPWYFDMLREGFPLLKKYLLYQNHYDVPDLREWKERVTEAFPDAPVATFERNLLRTSPADRLERSFRIVTQGDGTVFVPEILEGPKLRAAARTTPTFDHWWAFLVDNWTHELPENSRAIFEVVRHDPSIKKVVLTRSRAVDLDGENVVVLPMESPEGQHHLIRCGQVLVAGQQRATLMRRTLDWESHRLILVRDGLSLQKHGSALRSGPVTRTLELPKRAAHALLTSSDIDHAAELTAHYPATYEIGWRTGLPLHDFLLMPEDRLPADMRSDLDELRARLDGRRLLLFVPGKGRSRDATAYRFSPEEIDQLHGWASANNAVIGLREHRSDQERAYHRQLGARILDISSRVVPHTTMALRAADALLTDVAGEGLDFLATGRPVINFVPDLDEIDDTLFYDLDQIAPAPVCRTFADLQASLQTVFDEPGPAAISRYQESRSMFFGHHDAGSAQRAVDKIRSQYVDGSGA